MPIIQYPLQLELFIFLFFAAAAATAVYAVSVFPRPTCRFLDTHTHKEVVIGLSCLKKKDSLCAKNLINMFMISPVDKQKTLLEQTTAYINSVQLVREFQVQCAMS